MKRALSFVSVAGLLLIGGCSQSPAPTSAPQAASALTPSASIPALNLASVDQRVRDRLLQLRTDVEKNLNDAERWGKLGEAFQALELYGDAESCYREAVRLDAQSARWRYLLGASQLVANPNEGLSNLAAAIPFAPATNDCVRLAYGKALAERGQLREAAAQFEQLLSAQPAHPVARLELARLKLGEADPQKAAELLALCLTNQFTARPARLLLAQAKLRLGDAATAEHLNKSASLAPKPFDWPDPYLREVRAILPLKANLLDQASSLIARDRAADAEALLVSLLQQDPTDPDTLLLFGRLRAQQKRFTEAEDFLKRHLSARTNSVQGWMQLGIAHFRNERWPAAAEAFQRAAEIKPDYAEAHANLGFALARQNKSPEAIAAFQAALRCDPSDTRTLVALGEEQLRSGQTKEAAESANAALAINPQDPRAQRLKQVLNASNTSKR